MDSHSYRRVFTTPQPAFRHPVEDLEPLEPTLDDPVARDANSALLLYTEGCPIKIAALVWKLGISSETLEEVGDRIGISKQAVQVAVRRICQRIGIPHNTRSNAAVESYRDRALAVHARKGTK